LDTSLTLFTRLDDISDTLINNFRNENKSYPVEDLTKIKRNLEFNQLWEHQSNIPDKKNSKNEFKGLHAFALIDNDTVDFMYVGISQRTRARFSDHTKGKKSKYASWA